MSLASLLLLAYLLAKVSAVAVALLCCSIKKSNILEYRITTIRLVIFSAIGLSITVSDLSLSKTIGQSIIGQKSQL
jgi:hypothetical protein